MGRVKEIDGLRAIAILLVVAWHYLGTTGGPDSMMWKMFIFGRTGVDLFFVLSGYLITAILLNNRNSPSYFRSFYGRRVFRILPIYYAMFGIYVAGVYLSLSPTLFAGKVPEWTYAAGLQNFWMAVRQDYGAMWLGGTWSLVIEEQFYLLFPMVVLLVPLRVLPKVLIAIMIACPIGRAIAGVMGDHYAYYVLMPLRADILAVGALIAWVEYSGAITEQIRTTVRKTLIVTTCLLPLFALAIAKHSDLHMALWGHTYLVGLYGAILFTVLQMRGSQRLSILRSRTMGFFAKISYALYLVHVNVWILVCHTFGVGRNLETQAGIALTALSFALSVSICALSWRFFEGPLQRMGHSIFTYGSPRAPAPRVAPAE